MFNWLKRLFEKEYPMFEPGMIYFPPIKETYQKIPEIGEIYQLENEKGFYVFIDSVDLEKNHINFYMCDEKGFIYSIPKQTYSIDFFLKVYKQFRKAKAMDEIDKEFLANRRNFENGLISAYRYSKNEIDILNRHNPSPERKEMELLSGRKYENKELKDNFVFITGFYGNKVYFTNVFSSEKIALTHEQFRLIYKEWHEPRTLKLEDLNKAWIKKDNSFAIYKIVGVDENQSVFVCSRDHGVVTIANIELFFVEFREATQSDIDNLTKGE